ncbi:recombinase family protein [Mycobacterium koreense]|uniref:Resolvase n=1 Tax=Mycolicibacillus koreensis TaxID=1069220 RepID=A0A7I7SGW9_9MYCO|nr:recombinase family protein [Mycolicibacillus koreensis]MCV7250306.1 recombinase family protein [Mycolicibacillus koreensis]OSC33697.1 resolvase [Mycolicibacillus koreensis]BBY56187.1 putative resolvase/invertase/recombinase [Mycolicibacillus koreensis]
MSTTTTTTTATAAYLRVSTGHQSVEQQHDRLAAAGVEPDRTFTDTASGRAGSERPGLASALGWLRAGDRLVVVALDRLGRSVVEVTSTVADLAARGIVVQALREGVDTSTPTGRAVAGIMASLAELELELGRERRQASREARVSRGLPATRPSKLNSDQRARLVRLYRQGEPVGELMGLFGVSRATVFRVVRRHRAEVA